MHTLLHNSRWHVSARGILALLFGLATLLWPNITLQVVVMLIGVYLFADGVFATAASVKYRGASALWWIAFWEGACGIVAGLVAMLWPSLAAAAVLLILGVWALITGVMEILLAWEIWRETGYRATTLLMIGIASLLLGLHLMVYPQQSALIVTWLVGLYALLCGVLLIALAAWLQRGFSQATARPV